MERGFDYFDHTADVGIRAWGPTLDVAFAEAARGLVANMVDVTGARETGDVVLEAEAESMERLLFRFLEDVLYLFETQLWVATRIEVQLHGHTRLSARLWGERHDLQRHGHVHEIKAITYHDLDVRPGPPAEVRVIVDI